MKDYLTYEYSATELDAALSHIRENHDSSTGTNSLMLAGISGSDELAGLMCAAIARDLNNPVTAAAFFDVAFRAGFYAAQKTVSDSFTDKFQAGESVPVAA